MYIEERKMLEAMLQEIYDRNNISTPKYPDRYVTADELEDMIAFEALAWK